MRQAMWGSWWGAVLLMCAAAASADSGASAPPAASAPDAVARAAEGEALVKVFNRPVAVLRASLYAIPPRERARRTERAIAELLAAGGPAVVTVDPEPIGSVFLIDGVYAMLLTPQDVDVVRRESLADATRLAELALRQAITESRELRDRGRLLHSVGWSALATFGFATVVWTLWLLRHRLAARTTQLLVTGAARAQVGGAPLLHASWARSAAIWIARGLAWLLLAALTYQWLAFVLQQFPFTRVWGERLGSVLRDALLHVAGGIVSAVPDLLVAVLIFLLARLLTRVAAPVFERLAAASTDVGWLDRDTVGPTRHLFNVAVWLFAVVMAYPYLPGADTDAFKGVSVLVGLMLTIGGSNLVGQGASGLILMYSRTLRVGEFVRINDQEGTVTEVGVFTTKIRTGLGEEVSLPNAVVLGTTTKNYSRAVKGRGYVVDTTVTIGYDTPWRQVQDLLVDSARRTPGVLADPAPQVFTIALSDFYVEYRLVAQAVPDLPRPRAEVLATLHTNILDAFNAAGVQIMSPHYFSDPAEPKLVPPGAAPG